MLPPLPLRCLGSPGPSPLGAFVYNRFFLGRAGQGKRRNRDAPSPATKFLIRSHAMVRVPSSASARVQRGIGGSWEKRGRKPAPAETSRPSEQFTHLFSRDHENMESPVINRLPMNASLRSPEKNISRMPGSSFPERAACMKYQWR